MIYNKKKLRDINPKDIENKRVILRCDFNVPIDVNTGKISDTKRIDSALETIKYLINNKAKIILLSHLGRIKSIEEKNSNKKSLKIVYEYLKNKLIGVNISFENNNTSNDLVEKSNKMEPRSIMLLENTRYCDVNENGELVKDESKNNPDLGKFWASLGDIFVNDAFGTSHRSHASNVGIAKNIKNSVIGFLIEKELKKLQIAINNPKAPVVAIFGGAKIADKVDSIKFIGKFADKILIGGGMSYGFLKAQGYEIGTSLFFPESEEINKQLLEEYKDKIVLPVDFICAKDVESKPIKCKYNGFNKNVGGFDIGPKTIKMFKKIIKNAKTIIWNGPVGVFEYDKFRKGTLKITKFIASATIKNNCYSLIGGGDSAAAAQISGFDKFISHISTGGGASLDFLSDKTLPGIEVISNAE